ncbi:MAG: thioredoxin family protein [Candidatus Dependentiae bacterium]|nr:thioredoxin family protein [Candidatus Dependentiae bacterium]
MKRIINYSILYLIFATSSIAIACPHDEDLVVAIETEDDLQNLLNNNEGPCLISFFMDRCGWCKKMHPIIENLAQDNQFYHITFYTINGPLLKAAEKVKEILNVLITGYPTMLLMNQGKVIDKQIGGTSQEAMTQKLNKSLPKTLVS